MNGAAPATIVSIMLAKLCRDVSLIISGRNTASNSL